MTDVRTIVDGIGGVLAVGGTVVASPLLAPCYRKWGATEPEKTLVLGGTLGTRTGQGVAPGDPLPEAYYTGINAFVLERAGVTTRLLFRKQLGWSRSWTNALIYRVFLEPISFVMARRMLLGIEQRAETQ